jgi:hypothetical protein
MGAAVILSVPVIVLGRRRVQWRIWELLGIVLPFCFWMAGDYLMTSHSSNTKGWGNMIEPYFFCLGIPLGAIVRVVVGRKYEIPCAVIVIVILCLSGTLVALLTPNLGGSLG